MKDFALKILEQYWIDKDPNNDTDLCSHGKIYLRINSQEILTESDDDWTVSTSALLLLRTLFQDYDEPQLILHCGMLLLLSCPISITWLVEHKGKKVCIDKVRKNPTTNTSDTIEFPNASVELELREYAFAIWNFSEDVVDFFRKEKERKFFDDHDKIGYERFWIELNELRSKTQEIISN